MYSMASAFLVLAGALCALGGYCVGAWRQRLQFRMELDAEDLDSHERALEMIESLSDGGGSVPSPGRNYNRPN